MGKRVLYIIEEAELTQKQLPEESIAPCSASSSVTCKGRPSRAMLPSLAQAKAPDCVEHRLQNLAIDLLCLHYELSRLQGSPLQSRIQ